MNWANRKDTLELQTRYIFLEDNCYIFLWNIQTVGDIKYLSSNTTKITETVIAYTVHTYVYRIYICVFTVHYFYCLWFT